MKSPEDFAAFMRRIEAHPPSEQREHLLEYFNEVLSEMQVPEVRMLRAHLLRTFRPCPVQELMIEVLDGHLAIADLSLGG